jgi:hypothetical protein
VRKSRGSSRYWLGGLACYAAAVACSHQSVELSSSWLAGAACAAYVAASLLWIAAVNRALDADGP